MPKNITYFTMHSNQTLIIGMSMLVLDNVCEPKPDQTSVSTFLDLSVNFKIQVLSFDGRNNVFVKWMLVNKPFRRCSKLSQKQQVGDTLSDQEVVREGRRRSKYRSKKACFLFQILYRLKL